ncbi:fibropellin-1-like [Chrysoperla carnea]|uniref:fibropellin-1-like n=1 Tax=Chrysoperla carnea TaxID=189513 RepID=UPI001D08FA95|nr:fibropellin-1-like [Chrysoperla carnea]
MNFPNLLQITSLLIISSQTVLTVKSSENEVECGGVLTEPHGVLQTPNFPRPFNVPISCRWIIDASNIDAPNPSIVVYLTQLYVFTGLTFHEYAHYESESLKVGGQLIHTVTEQNVTRVLWIRTPAPFMVIEFRLDRLEGNHLRVLDNLLDVYGFNITYEISTFANPVRANSCNVFSCSYTGHCYVSYDFRNFACACFDGFSGPKCGTGPRCPINEQVCYNGGTCSHLGANDATCQCPPGYTGDRCDIQLPNSTEVGCEIDQESSSINCVSQCPVDEYLSSVCDCSHDDNKYVSDKVRYEGTIRLANLPAIRTSFPGYSTLATATSRSLEAVIEKQVGF